MNKKEFIETLIDIGGCGAEPETWDRGWDDAIGEVIGIAEDLDELEKPATTFEQAHDLLRKESLLSEKSFDHYWKCIADDVELNELPYNAESEYKRGFEEGAEFGCECDKEKPVIPEWLDKLIRVERDAIQQRFIDPWLIKQVVESRLFTIESSSSTEKPTLFDDIQIEHVSDNYEMIINAILYGYEVEKEKKYRVVFPYKWETVYLREGAHGDFDVIETETYGTQYTEAEIKAIDERYFAFAQEVTE